MLVTAEWHDETKRTIRFDFYGRWGWQHLYRTLDKVFEWLDSVDYVVDFIVHVHYYWLPPAFGQNVSQLLLNAHPRSGAVVVVMDDWGFMAEVLSLLFRAYAITPPGKFYFVSTIEQAETYLMKTHQRANGTALPSQRPQPK